MPRRAPVRRTTFWLVVDHVGISLVLSVFFFTPFTCGTVAAFQGLEIASIWFSAVVASLIGTGISVRNLRSFLLVATPRACAVPATVLYGMGVLGMIWLVSWGRLLNNAEGLMIAIGIVVCSTSAFSYLSWNAFNRLATMEVPGFEVQRAMPVEPLPDSPTDHRTMDQPADPASKNFFRVTVNFHWVHPISPGE